MNGQGWVCGARIFAMKLPQRTHTPFSAQAFARDHPHRYCLRPPHAEPNAPAPPVAEPPASPAEADGDDAFDSGGNSAHNASLSLAFVP